MNKKLIAVALVGVGLLVWSTRSAFIIRKPHPASAVASILSTQLNSWALEHGGQFPGDWQEFVEKGVNSEKYGATRKALADIEVLEYHGGRSTADNGATPLLKMRLRSQPDSCVELFTGGSSRMLPRG